MVVILTPIVLMVVGIPGFNSYEHFQHKSSTLFHRFVSFQRSGWALKPSLNCRKEGQSFERFQTNHGGISWDVAQDVCDQEENKNLGEHLS